MIGLKRTLATALLMTVSFGALAAETVTTYTFDSLSKIEYGTAAGLFTGILVNESTPTTVSVRGSLWIEPCLGFYATMLKHPAEYVLSVTYKVVTYPPPSPESVLFTNCSLERKP